MKFYGEYVVRLNIGVRIEADSLEAAREAVKDLLIDVDDVDGVKAHEWDITPMQLDLFEGDE